MKLKFPQLNNPCTGLDLIRAFNYNAVYSTEKQDKRKIKTYLDGQIPTEKTKNLKGVNEYTVDSTTATLAHLVSEGYELPEDAKSKLDKTINLFLIEHQKEPEQPQVGPIPTPKVKKLSTEELAGHAIGEMEFEIDQLLDNNVKSDFSTYHYVKGKDFKQNVCMEIKRWFKILQKELQYVLTTGLQYKDYRENYNFLTKPQQKRFKKYVDGIISDCDKYMKERKKPRQKKTKVSTQDAFDKNLQTI